MVVQILRREQVGLDEFSKLFPVAQSLLGNVVFALAQRRKLFEISETGMAKNEKKESGRQDAVGCFQGSCMNTDEKTLVQ